MAEGRSIVLASSNATKREKLRWVLEGLPLTAVEPATDEVVAETGQTFAENAWLKALAASGQGLAIASDGGVEVPAFGERWDALRTGRLGPERLDALLRATPEPEAIWHEALAIADSRRLVGEFEAERTRGLLLAEPRGAGGGFWVWEHFYFPGLGKTWAEANESELVVVDATWSTLKTRVHEFLRRYLSGPGQGLR